MGICCLLPSMAIYNKKIIDMEICNVRRQTRVVFITTEVISIYSKILI